MRPLLILFRKELHAACTSPIAYTMATVFLLVLGYTFSLTLFATKVANLNYIFHQIYVLSILLVPVLTMRGFAEERRTDTLELLLTASVREIWIVLAKFLAALSLMVLMFLGSLAYAVVLGLYGDPDWGPIYSGYLGVLLNASLLVSLGLLMSSLTENQVVAAALSLGTFLMLWFADSVAYLLPQPFELFAVNLSLIGHFKLLASGEGVSLRPRLFHYTVLARPLSDDAAPDGALSTMAGLGDSAGALWFCGVITALLVLFAAGLRAPIPAIGLSRWLTRSAVVGAAVAVTIGANMALYRHDLQFDLTHEQAFTPSAEAQEIVRGLSQPVQLTYFYQKQDPAGRGAATIVQLLARLNPRLEVDTVDSDQHPALANQMGVQIYNTAVVRAGERRIQVITTDEEDAILRAIRARETVICFATGHGEYDIDNFEFHTHFEGVQSHSHNIEGVGVVQMQQHGLGRLRRTIERSSASVPARH